MKKILCVLLAAMLLVACFAGCKSEPDDLSSVGNIDNSQTQETFKKPESYASIVLVTINPQFRLYLDASGTVLAVEPVNNDAKSIETKVVFENKNVQEVVNNLIVAANDGGFIKENAKIDIKVTEVVDKKVVATDVLEDIKTSANQKLTELEIKADITTAEELETEEPAQSEEADTPDAEPETEEPTKNEEADTTDKGNTSSQENSTASKPQTNEPQATACKHSKTKFKPITTGKNIIDNSKLDIVEHAKFCEDCDANLGLEKHSITDGKCTACGQSNFAVSTKNLTTAGVSGNKGLDVAEINSDGSLSYNLVIEKSWWDAKGEALDMWKLKISEAEMLKAIRTKFIMSDAEFKKLKAQGSYECSLGTQTYSKGYFYCQDPAAGGPGDYSHSIIGYKDDKNGTFTVYYDYLKGGPDVEESERKHEYYYTVVYTYDGASNLKIDKVDEEGYVYYNISGWTPVVNSMRIKAIKKVTNISGITAS